LEIKLFANLQDIVEINNIFHILPTNAYIACTVRHYECSDLLDTTYDLHLSCWWLLLRPAILYTRLMTSICSGRIHLVLARAGEAERNVRS